MNPQLKEVHTIYCQITGLRVNYAIHEHVYADYLEKGFTPDDCRVVLEYLVRENKRMSGARYSLRHSKLFDWQYEHFDSLLAEARQKERSRPKPKDNREKIIECFRGSAELDQPAPALSLGEVMKRAKL